MVEILLQTAAADGIWQVAAQSGFNALLVVLLLYYGRMELKSMGREMRGLKQAQDRNTKLVTLTLLQLATLMPGVREQLHAIHKEIDESERNDGGKEEE